MKGLKLNKTQISVLASEIYTELEKEANMYKESDEYKNFEDTLKNDDKYKQLKKLSKTVVELSEKGYIETDSWSRLSYKNAYKSYADSMRDKAFENYGKFPTKTSIENKIILNTIDVDNLDELISKVKDSFKTV